LLVFLYFLFILFYFYFFFFFLGFTGGFNLLFCLLRKYRNKDDGWNSFLAGAGASLALLFQPQETRRTVSMYLFARLLQCAYNSAKQRGLFSSKE
jgi:hypothetical protein